MNRSARAIFAPDGPLADGLPFRSAGELLEPSKALIDRLLEALDPSDAMTLRGVEATLEALADWVQLLPASEGHHHAEPGGLLRHSLEVAAGAVNLSLAQVGDLSLSGAKRRRQEERIRLSALIAGLCHDLGKPVADLSIIDPSGLLVWNPWHLSLGAWGKQHGLSTYHPIWRAQRGTRHRLFPPLLLAKVVDHRLLMSLREGGARIESELLEALLGDGAPGPLARCLREADSASVQRDLRDPRRPLAGLFSRHPSSVLVEAMRARVRDRRWEANRLGQPLFHLEDGLYLAWPGAAHDLAETIAADRLRGIPLDPELLALFFEEQGLAEAPTGSDGSAMVSRQPEGLEGPLRLLRLRSPRLLYPGLVPEPIISDAGPEIGADPTSIGETVAHDPLIVRLAEASDQFTWALSDDRVFLDHQAASSALGMAALTLIRQLDRGQHLDPDTQGGARKVSIYRGRRGLMLNPESSRRLLLECARKGHAGGNTQSGQTA